MKRIDAIFPTERLSKVYGALKNAGAGSMTIFNTRGHGQIPAKHIVVDRGSAVHTPEFNPNTSLMVVVKDGDVDKVVQAILQSASTGLAGEGKVFVTDIDDVVDISNKKRGEQAL